MFCSASLRYTFLIVICLQVFIPIKANELKLGEKYVSLTQPLQEQINDLARNGGGTINIPTGVFIVEGIIIPSNITLKGSGPNSTILALPKDSSNFLLASESFVKNKQYSNKYGGIRDLTLKGNGSSKVKTDLLTIKSYRFTITNCVFSNSSRHGINISAQSLNGSSNKNGFAEIRISENSFDKNLGAGVYGTNATNRGVADVMIYANNFNANGKVGYYQIHLERSAGFQIYANQMYAGHLGDISASKASAFFLRDNNFDGSKTIGKENEINQVIVETSGWGTAIISGNIFHEHGKNKTQRTMLKLLTTKQSKVIVSNNIFKSEYNSFKDISLTEEHKKNIILDSNLSNHR
ncbi:hypothetical protein [uncultured Paraglaciecola sp.]|uniref:hypothetical protein n=1 Tax=uncultured Paraglaciecola sp. TaxID=1765024 RepID=UPI002595C106|nr:hypothetical protein [uncultured Paraglaciecola sp.]